MTKLNTNNDSLQLKINDDLTDNTSVKHSSNGIQLISNDTDSHCPIITESIVADNTIPVVAGISPSHLISSDLNGARGALPRLLPLPGVSLPKSDDGWREMNHFFDASSIFA